jgi:hypothetical protein
MGPSIPVLTVYADGRLLTDESDGRLMARQLSAWGIDALVAELTATGYFETSHQVPLELLPGVEPPDIEVPLDRFRLLAESGQWTVVTNVPAADPRWFVQSVERDVLAALADRLPAADFLPKGAWIAATRVPYQPQAVLLFSGFTPFPSSDPICSRGPIDSCALDVSTVAWPLEPPPEGFGAPFVSADGAQSATDHCVVITPRMASLLAAALSPSVENEPGWLLFGASVPWRDRNGFYEIGLRALLPEEQPTCAGKSLPPTTVEL